MLLRRFDRGYFRGLVLHGGPAEHTGCMRSRTGLGVLLLCGVQRDEAVRENYTKLQYGMFLFNFSS
jgi:hypothetical protein